jgi:peptide/nickel transport system substrate-binding protein
MRWQAVIALVAIGAILVLAGRTAYSSTTVVVPDYGGTYVEGAAGNPRYVNPLLSSYNDVDRDLVALIFNGLTTANEHGEILPDLAESWELSPDSLSYTFALRQDVRWHDGTPFSADDVIFTIDLLRSADFQGQPDLSDLWRSVKVERLGTYTVRLTLAEPFAPFLSYTTIGLLPAHLLHDVSAGSLHSHSFNQHPVGTGPFELRELTARHALLEANTSYYAGRPYLDKIEFVFYSDYASALNAYRRGEVHGLSRLPAAYETAALSEEHLQLYTAPLSGTALVFLNLDRPLFQERAVRQALLWATDRQRLIDQVLNGHALLADGLVMPYSWAYEANATHYEYNPAKAIMVLEQAGWKDLNGDGVREKGDLTLQFALLTNSDETRVQIINELTRQWAQVGIRAVPQTVGVAGLVQDFMAPHNYDAILYEWQKMPFDPDPYPMWHSTQRSGSGQNYAGYSSEKGDLLMEAARSTTDPARRGALYRDVQRLLAEDVPVLPLYHPVYTCAVDARVHNVQVGPLHDFPDRFRTVREWYVATRRIMVSEAPFWKPQPPPTPPAP